MKITKKLAKEIINKMTILNLKTFFNKTVKKGEFYYYEHTDYHIFTNGKIVYGIRKGSLEEMPVQYVEELMKVYIAKLKSSIVLNEIINSYKNGNRTHVTNYENSCIKNHKVVKVFTDLWNKRNYVIIDRRYKNCCKSTNKIFKECFIIDTTIKNKELSLYFESTLDDNEFIMIMPIEIRKD